MQTDSSSATPQPVPQPTSPPQPSLRTSRATWVVLSVVPLFFVALCAGPIVEPPFVLLFGWIFYLGHVVPQVSVNWDEAGLAGLAIACFTLGAHGFARWLYAALRPEPTAGTEPHDANAKTASCWRLRWTLCGTAVVLLLFVAGTAMVGVVHQVAWLARSKEPMFEFSMEAAKRMSSRNNLKQIGLGGLNYHDTSGHFPPGCTVDRQGRLLHGWMTFLLPYVEQGPLFDRVDLQRPWTDPQQATVFATRLSDYMNPGLRDSEDSAGPAPSHYAGNVHLLGGNEPRTQSSIEDGLSNTIWAGEVVEQIKPWGYPANWRDPAQGIGRSPDGFGGPWGKRGNRGANFVLLDGSVKFIHSETAPEVLRALATPAGHEDARLYFLD